MVPCNRLACHPWCIHSHIMLTVPRIGSRYPKPMSIPQKHHMTISNITEYVHYGISFHVVSLQQVGLLRHGSGGESLVKALAHVISTLSVISFPSASVCKTLFLLTHETWMATFQTLHYTSATSQWPLERSLFNYNRKPIEKMERICCTIWEVWSLRATWSQMKWNWGHKSKICFVIHLTWNKESNKFLTMKRPFEFSAFQRKSAIQRKTFVSLD